MFGRSDLAALRVRKDVNELAKAKYTCSHATTRVDFPDGVDNMLRLIFYISIADHAGPYSNGDFRFYVEIPKTYPFHPPVVTCMTKEYVDLWNSDPKLSWTRTWHPNIDVVTGRVMIAILGKDWGPVVTINSVLLGLQLIFLEPGIDYVMNRVAADELQHEPLDFKLHVQEIMSGGLFYGHTFPEHNRLLEKRKQQSRLRLKRSQDDGHSEHRIRFMTAPLVNVHDDDCSMSVEDHARPRSELLSLEHSALVWKRKRLN